MKKHFTHFALIFTICSSLPIIAMEMSFQDQKETIETYMTEGANLDQYNHSGNTPLVLAAQNNDDNLVHKLVAFGASVNTQALNGSTPLSEAVRCRNFNVVNFLLDHGAQSDIQDEKGETALSLALDYGFAELAQLMVSSKNRSESKRTVKTGDKQNQDDKKLPQKKKTSSKKTKGTFSHFKVQLSAGVDAVKLLMTNHKKNASQQQSALHDFFNKKTSSYDKQSCIEGHSQLVSALYSNNMQKIEALLEGQSFDINQQDTIMGLTPLAEACFVGNYKAVKRFINTREALIELPDNKGITPLMRSISQKHDRIVRFLIKKGANINAQDHDGETTLIKAICFGSPQTVDLLIDMGADINICDNNGSGPLFFAVTNTNPLLIEKLINRGAYIDGHSSDTAPLLEALRKGNAPIAQFLIEHGANCKARGRDGITAIKKAKRDLRLEHLVPLMKEQISSQPQEYKEQIEENYKIVDAEMENEVNFNENKGFLTADREEQVATVSQDKEENNPFLDELLFVKENESLSYSTQNLQRPVPKFKLLPKEKRTQVKKWGPINHYENFKGLTQQERTLFKAILMDDLPTIQYETSQGITINFKNQHGFTPLMIATMMNRKKIFQWLIGMGANINAKDNVGANALWWAINRDRKNLATILINSGIDIVSSDNYHDTPLKIAMRHCPKLCATILNEAKKRGIIDELFNEPQKLDTIKLKMC